MTAQSWTVTLVCVWCGASDYTTDAPDAESAMRKIERGHNEYHTFRRHIRQWPGACCWASAARPVSN